MGRKIDNTLFRTNYGKPISTKRGHYLDTHNFNFYDSKHTSKEMDKTKDMGNDKSNQLRSSLIHILNRYYLSNHHQALKTGYDAQRVANLQLKKLENKNNNEIGVNNDLTRDAKHFNIHFHSAKALHQNIDKMNSSEMITPSNDSKTILNALLNNQQVKQNLTSSLNATIGVSVSNKNGKNYIVIVMNSNCNYNNLLYHINYTEKPGHMK